jgi:hypothetical protein
MLPLQKTQAAGLAASLMDAMRDRKARIGASIGSLSLASTDAVRIAAEGVRNSSAANTAFATRIGLFIARQSPVGDVVVVGGVLLCGFVAWRTIDYMLKKSDEKWT